MKTYSATSALTRQHVWLEADVSPFWFHFDHNQGIVGCGHTAGGPLLRVPILDVGVEQRGVVGGVAQGENARALAVVDSSRVGTQECLEQGHGETLQPARVGVHWLASAVSGGSQASLHLVSTGHRLQGPQQKESTVLAHSCSRGNTSTSYKVSFTLPGIFINYSASYLLDDLFIYFIYFLVYECAK